ncbi:MAG: methyltransferase domain-containing protein [Candidatus Adiutrix sp.]|jgi:SAM-dependent methyltransferase|nr:methyltransferase domain-containing protein [Candidatus Adiutrix sp.]
MDRQDWTPSDIFQLSGQVWEACALYADVKLDLFTALAQVGQAGPGGLTPHGLASRIGGEPRATDMLVTALVAMKFLERDGNIVKLTAASRKYLAADSPEYLGYIIKHMSHILPSWVNLTKAVATGQMVAAQGTLATDDEEEREAFLMGMFNTARLQADRVAEALDLSGRTRLLDLGGGPGTYAVHFCRRYPDLTAVVFDQPATEKFARATFRQFDLERRIEFQGGDFLRSDLPGGFDAAWLSQVLHGEAPPEAARLVKRGAETLAPGGLLAIQEFIIDDDRSGPAPSALFSLNMLVQTSGGQAYTQAEIAAMMSEAGLQDIKRLNAPLPPGCGIMVGYKG